MIAASGHSRGRRLATVAAPLAASIVVLVLGAWLTAQALPGSLVGGAGPSRF